MKANNDKCHLIFPNHSDVSVKLGKEHIIAEDSVTLLGVIIDWTLQTCLTRATKGYMG